MGLSRHLPTYRRRDMAVDLGTANTVVYVRHEGIVLFEPSVIAIDETNGRVQAVGDEAKRMLRRCLAKANGNRWMHQRVVLCVPSGITDVEGRAVKEATLTAGAREADVIEEPMAGAIGAGLPIAEPRGQMVVDIGGGTTEVAVISLGGIVVSESLRIGGYELDGAVKETLERTPPELSADITRTGILLAGGGVLLRGFAERLSEETGMPTRLADDPLTCVAIGSGMALEEVGVLGAADSSA